MTPPTLRSRFTLEPVIFSRLCCLYDAYRLGWKTNDLLSGLQENMGPDEYQNFEADLQKLMGRMPAWDAVVMIARAAKERTIQARPSRRTTRRLYDYAAQFEQY